MRQGISSWRGVHAGYCQAWPLPADATCASVARQVFRDAVSEVGLEPGLLDDCILMASELAANTLHAQAVAGVGGGGNRLASVAADVEGEQEISADPAPQTPQTPQTPQAPQNPQAPQAPSTPRTPSNPQTQPGPYNPRIPQTPYTPQAPQGPQLPQVLPDPRTSPEADTNAEADAQAKARAPQAPQDRQLPVGPELWLYLRGLGARRELVCKVFDCVRGWRHGSPPSPSSTSVQAVTGRGLQIVHELSEGRWGHHPTRARLGGWGRRGKAVWFAVPAPLAHARLADATGLHAYTLSADVTAARASERLSARQAARELEAMLKERGFGRLLRADQPTSDMSVLSVGHGLTVWCRDGVVSLSTPGGSSLRWNYADLVEAAEQTVWYSEELEFGAELDLDEDLLARAQ
jgi:hypothetical protein